MALPKRERLVMSVGGSLVCPGDKPDANFLKKFKKFVKKLLKRRKHLQLFLIIGGGGVARNYIEAASEVVGKNKLSDEGADWLGIDATQLNAGLVRWIFDGIARPKVITHYDALPTADERVVVGCGWKPGWSTDFDAVLVCKHYEVETLINLSNIDQVCDKDPNEHSRAKPLHHMAWKEFQELVGKKWTPGLNTPFDPVASLEAAKLGLKVVILRGDNLKNLDQYLQNKPFVGTTVGPA